MKLWIYLLGLLFFASCASVGKNFEFKGPQSIIIGQTKIDQVEKVYGKPFRIGYSSGNLQWTYLIYRYSIFSEAKIKDLVVTFDKNEIVSEYTYSSSADND